ncbi:RNI-like protein [Glarea lozoyensis ATCC 20868]|uniref:RNI-like protein n=1 Tax=Glarea lozoyensis (strain ATCC 20868 / MF5171) TaxID=1116229 RepID=S3DA46_GLAL2|nr:RNI-like protein [Glarea lozoyensis ATCC 20868]EPE34620.1 RNI-like protein [Glarea lozoyensis ATCC 20868]
MAQFLEHQESPAKKIKTRSGKKKKVAGRFDIPAMLDVIGELITTFVYDSATNLGYKTALEDITGQLGTVALQKWTSRLANLKSMSLYDGSVLDGTVAESIFNQCPNFDDLTFLYSLPREGIDQRLSSFFNGLKPNSLRSLSVLSANEIGPETLLALNHHSNSLRSLTLDGLRSDVIKNLSLLQGCDQLECLDIHDQDGVVDLEATENDVFLELVAWLGRCAELRKLKLVSVVSAPSILTSVCLMNNIRLHSLEIHGYTLFGNQDFHRAISHQTSLEVLNLRANPEDSSRDDIECLVDSICCLQKLKELRLAPDTADYFQTGAIAKLASHLPNLENFSICGFDIDDGIWTSIAGLGHLKMLSIFGLSSFTEPGILWYITKLKVNNRGLVLAIQAQDPIKALTADEIVSIQSALTAKVDGKLEYQLHREASSSEEEFSD